MVAMTTEQLEVLISITQLDENLTKKCSYKLKYVQCDLEDLSRLDHHARRLMWSQTFGLAEFPDEVLGRLVHLGGNADVKDELTADDDAEPSVRVVLGLQAQRHDLLAQAKRVLRLWTNQNKALGIGSASQPI